MTKLLISEARVNEIYSECLYRSSTTEEYHTFIGVGSGPITKKAGDYGLIVELGSELENFDCRQLDKYKDEITKLASEIPFERTNKPQVYHLPILDRNNNQWTSSYQTALRLLLLGIAVEAIPEF
ncbi:MAG: hypothetical protein ACOX0Z_02710 [Candidatus Nanosyncoccaceae bacterium]|jgi:hypothetical protein